jgi:hypothetical protein
LWNVTAATKRLLQVSLNGTSNGTSSGGVSSGGTSGAQESIDVDIDEMLAEENPLSAGGLMLRVMPVVTAAFVTMFGTKVSTIMRAGTVFASSATPLLIPVLDVIRRDKQINVASFLGVGGALYAGGLGVCSPSHADGLYFHSPHTGQMASRFSRLKGGARVFRFGQESKVRHHGAGRIDRLHHLFRGVWLCDGLYSDRSPPG